MRFKQSEVLRSITRATYTALQGEDLDILKDIDETDSILEHNDQKRNCRTGNSLQPMPAMFPCSIVNERLFFMHEEISF